MSECDGQRQSVYSRLLIEPGSPTYTFDANSHQVEFLEYSVKPMGKLIGTQGITGSLTQRNDRYIGGVTPLMGRLRMNISPNDLRHMLPSMTGGTFSTDTITFADNLPYFGVLFDTVGEIYLDSECKWNRWMIEGRAPAVGEEGGNEVLTFTGEILGKTRTGGQSWPGSPPGWGSGIDEQLWAMRHGALTIQSEARSASVQWFRLYCDYRLRARTGMGSTNINSICPQIRRVGLQAIVYWSDANEELIDEDSTGTAASLVFTNGTVSETLTISNLHLPQTGVGVDGRGPILVNLNGIITGTGTDSVPTEISWVNDNTV